MNTVQSAVRIYPVNADFADIGAVEDRAARAGLLRTKGRMYDDMRALHHSVWHVDIDESSRLKVYIIPGLLEETTLDERVGDCIARYMDQVFATPWNNAFRLMNPATTFVEELTDPDLRGRYQETAKACLDVYHNLALREFSVEGRDNRLASAKICAMAYAHAIPG